MYGRFIVGQFVRRLFLYIVFLPLAFQVAHSQIEQNSADFFYRYKTIFLSLGATLQGRFFSLGYMPYRYVFEFETTVEPKSIKFGTDSIGLNRNGAIGSFINRGGSDTNISRYIATMRGLRREKFKFLGALFEVDAGMNFKTWIALNNEAFKETTYVAQNLFGRSEPRQ